jgi:MoxR-like ATPase
MQAPSLPLQEQMEQFRRDYDAMVRQVQSVIVGMDEVVHQTLTCILAGGHALLEGVPGLGKTLLVRTFADVLELEFQRIQFTPDLMPADIIGTQILVTESDGSKGFRFQTGPIFANLVLADEINRATPKTQSAVLEAMQEQTVSVARTTYPLPGPFFVLATQNPLEMEGTYPLPEAQLDRFMFKVYVGRPTAPELVEILDRTTGGQTPRAAKVADARRLDEMKSLVRQVPAAAPVKEHIASIVLAACGGDELVRRNVRHGPSPRGAQAMLLAAKVRALCDGRANVAFEDVRDAALPALRHRLVMSFEAQSQGVSPDDVVRHVLEITPAR